MELGHASAIGGPSRSSSAPPGSLKLPVSTKKRSNSLIAIPAADFRQACTGIPNTKAPFTFLLHQSSETRSGQTPSPLLQGTRVLDWESPPLDRRALALVRSRPTIEPAALQLLLSGIELKFVMQHVYMLVICDTLAWTGYVCNVGTDYASPGKYSANLDQSIRT